jgi:hypothetical protein
MKRLIISLVIVLFLLALSVNVPFEKLWAEQQSNREETDLETNIESGPEMETDDAEDEYDEDDDDLDGWC